MLAKGALAVLVAALGRLENIKMADVAALDIWLRALN